MSYSCYKQNDYLEHMRQLDKLKELEELCRPVVEYIQKEWHPHTRVIIDWDRASVFEEQYGIPFEIPDDGGIEQIVWRNSQTGESGRFVPTNHSS